VNIAKMIYDSLQKEQGHPEVLLEDLIRTNCGYRHYLHLSGATMSKPTKPRELLVREIALRVRLLIGRYLKGCYGDIYNPGSYVMHGGITTLIDGTLGDLLVDIQVLSNTEYTKGRAPRRAVLSAATKAFWDGKKAALLICINRDSQEWDFYNVEGDLEKATYFVREDADYVSRLVAGDAKPMSLASASTCRICPFFKSCSMEPSEDPPIYTVQGLNVTPAMLTRTQMESYLWSLNDLPNNRTKKVIHPSSFSTSKCDRQIAYDLMGLDQHESINPRLRRIFDTGHCVHDVVQLALEEALDDFEAEVLVHHPELRILGHCDGRSGKVGFEFKSIGSKGYASLKKVKGEHEKQGTTYGVILLLDTLYYVYINKETGEIASYEVPIDRRVWHKLAARASNIAKTVEMGSLPPQVDRDYICRSCKYAWNCKPELGTTSTPEERRTFA